MSSNRKSFKIIVGVMLAVLAIVAVAGVAGSILSMVLGDDLQDGQQANAQPELSESAQPYRQDLEQAAQQCPSVLTAQRLDRYITDATGWDANWNDEHGFAIETVSVAGMVEQQWETTGGGDPADVPTAIRNVADLWCGHANTLAGEDIDFDYDLPEPADADDDPRAAALGLAAIYMGVEHVRSGRISVSHHPTVEQSMNTVL